MSAFKTGDRVISVGENPLMAYPTGVGTVVENLGAAARLVPGVEGDALYVHFPESVDPAGSNTWAMLSTELAASND